MVHGLGLSDSLLRVIDKRQRMDKTIMLGGMVRTACTYHIPLPSTIALAGAGDVYRAARMVDLDMRRLLLMLQAKYEFGNLGPCGGGSLRHKHRLLFEGVGPHTSECGLHHRGSSTPPASALLHGAPTGGIERLDADHERGGELHTAALQRTLRCILVLCMGVSMAYVHIEQWQGTGPSPMTTS